MGDRTYDIVVFGATGFTGQLVAEYLQAKSAEETFTWAIAGRNAVKLEQVKAKAGLGADVGMIVADSADYASLTTMTAQTQVLLTTVGPYIKYGEPVVRACVETTTDYVDITGEPEFVNNVIATYDADALDKQIRIINCCGFDSIPHDLGAYFTVKQLPDIASIKVEGFVSANATFSGGTWNSAIEAMGNMRSMTKGPKVRKVGEARRIRGNTSRPRYEPTVKGWVAPMPTIDPQVVLRSAKMLPEFGREFSYGHYVRVGKLHNLALIGTSVSAVAGLAQFGPTRNLLKKMRQSGEGPDEATRAKSSFHVTFVGEANGQKIVTQVSGGDPGYGETSKMIAESALALALDRSSLPKAYGVITTAVGLGDVLLSRLKAAGIKFERIA